MNVAVGSLDLLTSGLKRCPVACIGLDVEGLRAHCCQGAQVGPDGVVLGTPADPDDVRAILLHHKAAPGLADAAGTTDDHVNTPGTVQARVVWYIFPLS